MKTLVTSLLRPLRIFLVAAGLGHAALPSMAEEQKPEDPKGDPELAPFSTRAIGYEFDTLTHEITEIESHIKGANETAAKLTAVATKLEASISSLPSVTPAADLKKWEDKLKADSGVTLTNADLLTVYSLVEDFAKDATHSLIDATKDINTVLDSADSSFAPLSENSELDKVFEQYGVQYGFLGNKTTFVLILVQFMPELQSCTGMRSSLSKLAGTAPADAGLRDALYQICKSIVEKGTVEVAKATKDGITKLAAAAKKDAPHRTSQSH